MGNARFVSGLFLAISSTTLLWGAESAARDSVPPRAGFLLRHHAIPLRWEVSEGRILMPNLRSVTSGTSGANAPGGETEWKEVLAINLGADEALAYRFTAGDYTLQVEWKDRTFSVHEQRGEQAFHCSQAPTGEIVLISLDGPTQVSEVKASSLWHLAVLQETFFQQELLPRLELLSGSWGLREQARQVNEALQTAVSSDWPAARSMWRRDFEALTSPEYRQRQAALARLKAGGPATLAYLKQLPNADFDAEQRRCLEFLSRESHHRRDDPKQIAAALVYDQNLWWEILAHGARSARTLAKLHLSRLLERDLPLNHEVDDTMHVVHIRSMREAFQGDGDGDVRR